MHFSSASSILLTLCIRGALASPTSLHEKRDVPKLCKDSAVDAEGTTGYLFCVDDSGNDLTCNECQGLEGDTPASSSDGISCYISNGDSGDLGKLTACPGDSPPDENPDGSPSSDVSTGLLDAYCSAAGAGGLFGWTTYAMCYSYTFAKAEGNAADEATAGAKCKQRPHLEERDAKVCSVLCNTFAAGLCACIDSGVCGDQLGGGGSG